MVEPTADEEPTLEVEFSGVSQFAELTLASSAALKKAEGTECHIPV